MRNIERLKERAENMRKNPTFHEKKFAERMENEGLFFKSQVIIGNYIVDFLIGKTIVEIDGYSHFEAEQAAYDVQRTNYLESKGYNVIRVRNESVVSFDMSKLKEKRKHSYDAAEKAFLEDRAKRGKIKAQFRQASKEVTKRLQSKPKKTQEEIKMLINKNKT